MELVFVDWFNHMHVHHTSIQRTFYLNLLSDFVPYDNKSQIGAHIEIYVHMFSPDGVFLYRCPSQY
jgi:hypothetical protein